MAQNQIDQNIENIKNTENIQSDSENPINSNIDFQINIIKTVADIPSYLRDLSDLYAITPESLNQKQNTLEIDFADNQQTIHQDIKQQPAFKNCYQKALKILSYREYSCAKMMQKLSLADESYTPEIIKHVIQILQEKSWLDDQRVAESILYRYQRYGKIKINQILKKEGISEEIAKKAEKNLQTFAEKQTPLKTEDQFYQNATTDFTLLNLAKPDALDAPPESPELSKSPKLSQHTHIDEHDLEFKKACDLYQKKFLMTRLKIITNHDTEPTAVERQKIKQKQIRFLIQKGFDYQTAIKVIAFFA
jgi:SOS response regulatory protein OraA/RecX